jgi:hypothetical protein
MAVNDRLVAVGGGDNVIPLETDVTLAGNSDKAVATQKATKTYIDKPIAANMAPGAGFAGTGTVYKASVDKCGDLIKTTIFIDLTGAASSTTDLDIIGTSGVSHIGQIVAAVNGTIVGGRVTCLELPAGGADDIDLYSATEGTGAFDGGIGALAETALVTAGGAWASGTTKGLIAVPAADKYLYLTGGEAGTAASYTAGQFLIELYGVAA